MTHLLWNSGRPYVISHISHTLSHGSDPLLNPCTGHSAVLACAFVPSDRDALVITWDVLALYRPVALGSCRSQTASVMPAGSSVRLRLFRNALAVSSVTGGAETQRVMGTVG